MSKTNHNRNFVDYRFNHGQRTNRFITFSNSRLSLDGTLVGAGSTVATENSKGIRRDKAGAKKFVASRSRFHDRMGLQKIIKDLDNDQ